MIEEQDWTEAYKELSAIVKTKIPEIKHIDLWYEQINYLPEEYPYPEQCLFIDINTISIETLGNNVQALNCAITFYHVFDTLSDTFEGSTNQDTALAFMQVNKKIHAAMQGTSGNNFSPLNRTSNKRVPTRETWMIVREQTYDCIIMDYSACKEYTEHTITAVELSKGQAPTEPPFDMLEINL